MLLCDSINIAIKEIEKFPGILFAMSHVELSIQMADHLILWAV